MNANAHGDADAERRAQLIEDLAAAMDGRRDLDDVDWFMQYGFELLAAAVVEYLERHGLLKLGD